MAFNLTDLLADNETAKEEALSIVGLIFFFFFMLGLGCSIRFQQFKQKIRKPKGLVIGMFCQFLFMPFVTWLSAITFQLEATAAVALCIVGTCPGGALSNMLCYMFHSDVALSVAMTTASSVAAFVMLPVNIKLYIDILGVGVVEDGQKRLTSDDLQLEWGKILLSTLVVVAGTMSGMAMNKYFPKIARKAESAGMACGIGMLGITTYQNSSSGARLNEAGLNLFIAVLIPTISGLFAGISLARLSGLPRPSCVAVGMESSLQNAVLALAIIQYSMGGDHFDADGELIHQTTEEKAAYGRALTVPILYGLVSACCDIILGLALWKLSWTRAPASARPLRDFRNDWKKEGLKTALSLSHEKLKAMHLHATTQDLEQEKRDEEEFLRSGKVRGSSPSWTSRSGIFRLASSNKVSVPTASGASGSPRKFGSPKKRKLSLPSDGEHRGGNVRQAVGDGSAASKINSRIVSAPIGYVHEEGEEEENEQQEARKMDVAVSQATGEVNSSTNVPLVVIGVEGSSASEAELKEEGQFMSEGQKEGQIMTTGGLKMTQSLGNTAFDSLAVAATKPNTLPPISMRSLGSTSNWSIKPNNRVQPAPP